MSQRDVPDYFAFYPYEFLSDERVLAMTLEQVGAYLLLICSQWINGSIPSDIPTLARLLKRTTAEMEILWAGVGPCFSDHPDLPGRLVQKRVEEERARAISAITKERERLKTYRDRKKARAVVGETGSVQVQNGTVTVPSTLLYSSIYTESSKERKVDTDKWADFSALYPAHRFDPSAAYAEWIIYENEADLILTTLRLAVKHPDWTKDGGRYVPKASNFLKTGVYKNPAQFEVVEPPSPYREV